MTTPLSVRVVEAELRTYRRTWRGSVFTGFLNPILYLLAMGVGLGTLVDENLSVGADGISYLAFIAPGLLVATAMQTGAGEGAWKVMAAVKWRQTWHATLATPVGVGSLALGQIYWSTLRVAMVSASFAVVMVLSGVASPPEALGAMVPAILVGAGMAAVTTAFTVRLQTDAPLAMYFRFVVIPMFLFSGVLFPITQLPAWLQPVAQATPVFHGVELARMIALGITPSVSPWISWFYLAAVLVVGTVLVIAPLRRRLTP
ncbi:MAG: ABC transporter permease [Acidimicrobiia bacterium]|nr:ABC transporter permease [Acidimicrobiia bacterium]